MPTVTFFCCSLLHNKLYSSSAICASVSEAEGLSVYTLRPMMLLLRSMRRSSSLGDPLSCAVANARAHSTEQAALISQFQYACRNASERVLRPLVPKSADVVVMAFCAASFDL